MSIGVLFCIILYTSLIQALRGEFEQEFSLHISPEILTCDYSYVIHHPYTVSGHSLG